MMWLWGTTGALPNPLPWLVHRKISPDWGWTSSHPNWHGSHTLGVQTHYYKTPLPQSTKTVQIAGTSNELQEVPVSEPIPFCLDSLRNTHSLLLSPSTPIHLLGQDFKEKDHARIFFSQKREIILEIDSSHQSIPPGELNDPLTSFIFPISEQINLY